MGALRLLSSGRCETEHVVGSENRSGRFTFPGQREILVLDTDYEHFLILRVSLLWRGKHFHVLKYLSLWYEIAVASKTGPQSPPPRMKTGAVLVELEGSRLALTAAYYDENTCVKEKDGASLGDGLGKFKLLGPWYVLAVASQEKGFAVEKGWKNVEGVVVALTADYRLEMRTSRHRPEGCSQSMVELRRQSSGWVFENPALGVLEYRVLGTNFRDYAIVFTQLEFGDEAFNTVELYSRTATASQEAMRLFTSWSRGLGFLSQQQAQLQRDRECAGVATGCDGCMAQGVGQG
ncbi:Epididymal-specific lipocalin-6 [Tupaia chinensis]|uniref:Epididymal-specific lipocalin-6 n=1 Tax=Tupaia chinensis TaxID=246437 RepID=L8YA70_TUPCH|nr:Epididymal-specific lipocalin-6 [Tupaia chinensis]